VGRQAVGPQEEAIGQRDVRPRVAQAVTPCLLGQPHDRRDLVDRARRVPAQRVDRLVAEVVAPGLANLVGGADGDVGRMRPSAASRPIMRTPHHPRCTDASVEAVTKAPDRSLRLLVAW
jgi:hypothetical protein